MIDDRDLMLKGKVIIPVIRQLLPNVIASQIVGVQPMTTSTIVYGEWKKKFAWLPVEVKGSTVWLKVYYERTVGSIFNLYDTSRKPTIERGTIFDVMAAKDNNG